MSNKDYRELQVSSSHLVVIFIGILIVCGVSFLLGVNVGKRKAQLQGQASLPSPQVLSKVQNQTPAKDSALAAKPETQDKPAAKPAVESPKPSPQVKSAATETAPPAKETAKPPAAKPAVTTPPAAKQTIATPPPLTAAKGTFSIQVGAFEKREDALQTAKKFDGQGYICRVLDPFAGERVKYYRVRIGAFKTRAEAEAVRDKFLAGQEKKDYFIVQN